MSSDISLLIKSVQRNSNFGRDVILQFSQMVFKKVSLRSKLLTYFFPKPHLLEDLTQWKFFPWFSLLAVVACLSS